MNAWLTSRGKVAEALTQVLPKLMPPKLETKLRGNDGFKLLNGKAKWTRVRFGDVVSNLNETEGDPAAAGLKRFVGLEHLEPGSLHIRAWGNLADGTTFTRRCRLGQVLFGKRRAYQRKVTVAEFDAVVSGDIYVLAPKNRRLIPEFLPFLCRSERFFQHAIGTSAGSLSPRTNWRSLASFEFALPPLDQQRSIAEILWALDAQIVAFQTLRGSLETLRKSLFGPNLSGFESKSLREVVEFADGRRVPLNEKERASRKGPYPYYGASGVIDRVDDYIFDEPLILLSEDGFNLVNRTTRVAFKVSGKIWVNNHAHVLRPKAGINIDYLVDYLESISLEPFITGTYQRKLNKSECERIPVPVPPPQIQSEIADKIRSIEKSATGIDTHMQAARGLLGDLQNSIVEKWI
jgi:type I restriction enzyme S subunit